jgi:hypothetical protein
MQTTVDLPDSLYRRSEELAACRGASIEQFILEAIAKEVRESLDSAGHCPADGREIELPVIRSGRPGTLDLSSFDFDDLLA